MQNLPGMTALPCANNIVRERTSDLQTILNMVFQGGPDACSHYQVSEVCKAFLLCTLRILCGCLQEAEAGKKCGGDAGKAAKAAAAKPAAGKAPAAAPDTPKAATAAKQKPSAATASSSSKGKAKDHQALASKSTALFAHLPQYKASTLSIVS